MANRRSNLRRALLGALLGAGLSGAARAQVDARPHHLDASERERVQATLDGGARWLEASLGDDGGVRARRRADACPVALTAMALWAWVRAVPADADLAPAARMADYLGRWQQPNGGIYDPDRGLAVYTSGVASRALEAYAERSGDAEARALYAAADLFAYRAVGPESILDADNPAGTVPMRWASRAEEILASSAELDDDATRALDFLRGLGDEEGTRMPQRLRNPRWSAVHERPEAFDYEDMLGLAYQPLQANYTRARRAIAALRGAWDLEANPDLTKRYGEGGFQRPDQGIYYYYAVVARVLAVHHVPFLDTHAGERVDWPRALSRRLLQLRRDDGSWWNENPAWWEDEPTLTTSYALLALAHCRDARGLPEGSR